MRSALLPAVSLGLLGGLVLTVVTVVSPPAMTVYGILAVAAGAAWLVLVLAARASTRNADTVARHTAGRVDELRSLLRQGERDIGETARAVLTGHRADPGLVDVPAPDSADPFDQFAAELYAAMLGARRAVLSVADQVSGMEANRRFEAFTKIAWRWQSLVHRQIQLFDELENQMEDPDLLKHVYRADHLATRMRRLAESLAVVGGATPRRQLTEAVNVYEVVRSAVTAVEYYRRVKVLPDTANSVAGVAVANAIHLLAELIENATVHSRHEVTITTALVAAGLAIEIDDRGLGMPAEQQQLLNRLLADPSQIDRGQLLQDGRLGLYVVAVLAHRHDIKVELQTNAYGGVRVVVVFPKFLITTAGAGAGQGTPRPVAQARQPRARAAGRSTAAPPQTAFPQTTRSPSDAANGRQHGVRPSRQAQPGGQHPDPAVPIASPQSDREPPDLPQRRPQHSLAAELRDPPAAPGSWHAPGHAPNLMGNFRAGWRRSDPPPAVGERMGRGQTNDLGRDTAAG